jgi:hypothetical protein
MLTIPCRTSAPSLPACSILWELLTWELPFQNMSVLQIMLNITQQNARPPVPDQYGASALPGGTFSGYDEYVGLMRRCWAEDPEARPTFEKVGGSGWLLVSLAGCLAACGWPCEDVRSRGQQQWRGRIKPGTKACRP